MIYIFDSREKKNDHIKAYFEKHGIPFKVQKLDEGDYQIDGNPDRTVDRNRICKKCITVLSMIKADL